MIIDWPKIMFFCHTPKVVLLGEDEISVISLEKNEFQFARNIILEKILKQGKTTNDGKIWVSNDLFTKREIDFLHRLFNGLIFDEGEVELASEKLFNKLWITGVTFEVTSFCNFNCPHCLLPEEYRKRKKYLNVNTILNIIDQINHIGGYAMALTGGEPTFYNHSDMIKIIEHASDKMLMIMNTNAYNISKELAKILSEKNVTVKVSLYGCDESSYYKYTGVKNSFQRIKNSLELLNKYDAKIMIHVFYTKFHERIKVRLEDLLKFALDFTPHVRIMTKIQLSWDWKRKDLLTLTSKIKISPEIPSKLRRQFMFHSYLRRLCLPSDACAVSSVLEPYITSDGKVFPCPFLDEVVAHISNPQWALIYYVKLRSRRNFPWPGGRCGIKYVLDKCE